MLELLVEQLHSQDAKRRRQAARQLGSLHSPEVFKPLSEALYDPDINVRRAAAEALGELGDLRAIEPLIELAQDEERGAFQEVLDLLPSPVEDILARLGPQALDTLFNYLDNALVLCVLGKIGDPRAFEPLINIAQDDATDEYLRSSAILALGYLRDARALPALSAFVRSPGRFRTQAILALAHLGNTGAVDTLVELLNDPSTLYTDASYAAQSLRAINDEPALNGLISHAQTRAAPHRNYTLETLVSLKNERTVALFSSILRDPDDKPGWYYAIRFFWLLGGVEQLTKIRTGISPEAAHEIDCFIQRS
jgi:HEAT repeat protein